MIKHKHPLFNKTISKNTSKQPQIDQLQSKKTHRSYFKLNKPNLNTIIKNIQHSVKQLKNFHQSLHKNTSIKLQKSSSLHQINKLRPSSKLKSKESNSKNRALKKYPMRNCENKQNLSSNINHPGIESTVSKKFFQNGSTMLSIHNADVDEIKKAYQFSYGRQTSSIVDLYHFFKKNFDKSMRYNHGSIEMSSLPHVQHSEDMAKSRQNIYHRKSNQFLNVIIEDKSQKQPQLGLNETQKSCSLSISKLSGGKNLTMEEIFRGGCPDLANVYDFVKKRRISFKNYMNFNKNQKQNHPFLTNQITRILQSSNNRDKNQGNQSTESNNKQNSIKEDNLPKELSNLQSAHINNLQTKRSNSQRQTIILSEQKYFPQKSSKKSQKSSMKNSKKKLNQIDLNQNIRGQPVQEFNQDHVHQKSSHKFTNQFKHQDLNQNVLDFDSFLKSNEKRNQQKFVKSTKQNKQQSFDGSSISIKSCSRIIELDFIPLDL